MFDYLLDKEYSIDYYQWNLFIDNNKLNIDSLCEQIIQKNDPSLACFFAIDHQYQLHKMQKIVLDSNNAKYAFLFAKMINSADINALQQIVIKSNNINYLTKFACFIPKSNIKLLENLIYKSNKIKYIHTLFLNNKNINFNKYKKYILSCNNPKYLFELSRHIDNDKDIIKIQDAIIASGSAKYIRMFASKIKNVNISKLEEAILSTNNIKEIKKFAKLVKNSSMKNFLIV